MIKLPGEELSLSDHILDKQEAILERWRGISNRGEVCSLSSRLSFDEFLDHVPSLLRVFCDYLKESAGSEGIDKPMEVIRQHARRRWKQGFDLEELLRDLGKLQQAVLEEVCRYFDITDTEDPLNRVDAIAKTAFFFSKVLCSSAEHFRNLRREEASATTKELEQMRDYIGQIERARRHFLSEVSHELGSSLTAISSISELLKHDESLGNSATLNDFGQIIDESVSSASKVLESLLQLTRIDAGQSPVDLETVRLGEFLSKWNEKISGERKIDVKFTLDGTEDFEATVDIDKLRRTIETLFDFMKVDSNTGSMRVGCRNQDNFWTLKLNWVGQTDPENRANPTLLHRKEIDLLLLNRFCSIQKATFQLHVDEDGCHEIELNFPVTLDGET